MQNYKDLPNITISSLLFHFTSGKQISNKKGHLSAILSILKGLVFRKGSAMNKTPIITP